MIETIEFKGEEFLKLQSEGNAAQYAIPFAKKVFKNCKTIFDVGCNRLEWAYPSAVPIDLTLVNSHLSLTDLAGNPYGFFHQNYSALNLPHDIIPDAIFSSHFLEHFSGSWVDVLDYWNSVLPRGGIVFLYLPHYSQKYWRSWNNRKHVHNLSAEILEDYFVESGNWGQIFVTRGFDLNNSFYAIATKK